MSNSEDSSPTTYDAYISSTTGAVSLYYYYFETDKWVYRYTSGEYNRSFKGSTWISTSISHDRIRRNISEDTNYSLQITMPINSVLIQDYGSSDLFESIKVTIYQTFIGLDDAAARIIWRGTVAKLDTQEDRATLMVPNDLTNIMKQEIPRIFYQNLCNHVLYDSYCGVNKNKYSFDVTVQDSSELEVTLQNLHSSHSLHRSLAISLVKGGTFKLEKTGMERIIVGVNGDIITLNYILPQIQSGDKGTIYAGCDHSLATCKSKFGNTVNFGGYPFIPTKNPFVGKLK